MMRLLLLPLLLIGNYLFAGTGYVAGYDTSVNSTIWVFDTNTNTATALVTYAMGVPSTSAYIPMLAISPDESVIYIPDQSGNIYVVDPTINVATQLVTNSTGSPFVSFSSVAFTPDGSTAYASDAQQIPIIDVASNTATAIVTLAGGVPSFSQLSFIAISPDGLTAYATDKGNGEVYVIDTATNVATGTVMNMTGTPFVGPQWVSYSPDGTFAYVTDTNSHAVFVVDTATNTAISTISNGSQPAFSSPFGIVFNTTGTTAYVGDYGVPTVYIIDTATQTATGTISGSGDFNSSTPIQLALDGHILYITDEGQADLYVASTLSATVTTTLFVPVSLPQILTTQGVGTIGTNSPSVSPPSNLSATLNKNDFGLVYEICTLLTWSPSTSPTSEYRIYRNGILFGSVNGSTLSFQAHNTPKNKTTIFSVTAVDANGAESIPETISVR